MAKSAKKEISVSELAKMIANGFSGVDKKFEEVGKRFDEVDRRFDRVDDRLHKLESAVFNLDLKLQDVDKRLKRVEEALEPLLMGYRIMQRELKSINARIDFLERRAGVVRK